MDYLHPGGKKSSPLRCGEGVSRRGLTAVCKSISSTRRGALVFLTLQELRLPRGKIRLNQTTCNHPVGFMATQCCGTKSSLWAQSGIRNHRNMGSRADLGWKGYLGVSGPASSSMQGKLQSYSRLLGAWSTQFLKISEGGDAISLGHLLQVCAAFVVKNVFLTST